MHYFLVTINEFNANHKTILPPKKVNSEKYRWKQDFIGRLHLFLFGEKLPFKASF